MTTHALICAAPSATLHGKSIGAQNEDKAVVAKAISVGRCRSSMRIETTALASAILPLAWVAMIPPNKVLQRPDLVLVHIGAYMSKYRKSARGQDCMIRIPGVCNYDSATTVLAHINGGGMGTKTQDQEGAFCCSSCHDAIDGRVRTGYSREELKLMHLEGAIRTRDYWRSVGLL